MRRGWVEVLPGSGRSGDPHEVTGYDPAWPGMFAVWQDRLLWPPAARSGEVHVHVCGSGSTWERNHLLFRDYLRAHPAARDGYAALKRDLISRWRHDRNAYGAAKTGFVLDTLAAAAG